MTSVTGLVCSTHAGNRVGSQDMYVKGVNLLSRGRSAWKASVAWSWKPDWGPEGREDTGAEKLGGVHLGRTGTTSWVAAQSCLLGTAERKG